MEAGLGHGHPTLGIAASAAVPRVGCRTPRGAEVSEKCFGGRVFFRVGSPGG